MEKIKITNEMKDLLELSLEKFDTLNILFEKEKWRGVITNSYYFCYDLIKVGLLEKGIKTVTHEGVQSLITGKFVRNNEMPNDSAKFFNSLMDLRHLADYDPKFSFSKQIAKEACKQQIYLQKNMLIHLKNKFDSELFADFDILLNHLSSKINTTTVIATQKPKV